MAFKTDRNSEKPEDWAERKRQQLNPAGQGVRMRDVRKALKDERVVDPAQRVARLVRLGHEYGPEKLENEIAVLERKLSDLRAALAQVRAES